jgi:hypothetical protein
MIVGILQPSYLPWLGFLEQIGKADTFVLYDDVQFEKGSWRNRNRIKTPQGVAWLTVPVLTKGLDFPLIKDVRINNSERWGKKHVRTIQQNYSKAPYFDRYAAELFSIIERPWEKLIDLNNTLLFFFLEAFGLERNILLSSELGIGGASSDRLLSIIKALGGDVFYEGAAGRNYLDVEKFEKAGVEVVFQDYEHPVYPQLYNEFVPYLSVVDLLMNCGPESLGFIMHGGENK